MNRWDGWTLTIHLLKTTPNSRFLVPMQLIVLQRRSDLALDE